MNTVDLEVMTEVPCVATGTRASGREWSGKINPDLLFILSIPASGYAIF